MPDHLKILELNVVLSKLQLPWLRARGKVHQ